MTSSAASSNTFNEYRANVIRSGKIGQKIGVSSFLSRI